MLTEGGQRQPPEPRFVAEWEAVKAALADEQGFAGPCAACGMPMVGAPGGSWTIQLPSGSLTIADGQFTGPQGVVDLATAEAMVEAARPSPSLALRVFQTGLFAWLVVPLILWVCAFMCFSAFLCIGVPQGAEFMPRS